MGVGVVTHKVWRARKRTRKISTFEGQAGKEKPASDAKNEQWKENRRSKGVGSGSEGKQFSEETISKAAERLSQTETEKGPAIWRIVSFVTLVISVEWWE